MIEALVLKQLHDALEETDSNRERLARILLGNIHTLKSVGWQDIQPESQVDVIYERGEFAAIMRTMRTQRRLSQNRLARKMEYDQTLISKIERGKRMPSVSFMNRFYEVIKR